MVDLINDVGKFKSQSSAALGIHESLVKETLLTRNRDRGGVLNMAASISILGLR